MKIIHVIAYYNAKWDYQENHLAYQQALLGHEVHIFASNLNFPYTDYENTAEKALGPRLKPIGTFHNGSFTIHYLPIYFEFSARVVFKNIVKKLNDLEPNLVIVHGITQPITIQLCYSKSLTCPKIVDEHTLLSDFNGKFKKTLFALYGVLFHRTIEKSFDKIISIAESTTDVLTKLIKIAPGKVQLVPLGTDTSFFKIDANLGISFRQEYNIPLDSILIGYAGKIQKVKKIEVLIDACLELKTDNLHLLIVGNIEDSYKNIIIGKLKELSIQYTLLPSQPKTVLPALYNACSFLVWPAHQSISMMDVAACGKPFICPSYLGERLRRNQAIGIESGNKIQLINALKLLIENEKLREEMGENARKWALEVLSWNKVNKQFMAL